MIGEPPSELEAVNATESWAFPAVTVPIVGALGLDAAGWVETAVSGQAVSAGRIAIRVSVRAPRRARRNPFDDML